MRKTFLDPKHCKRPSKVMSKPEQSICMPQAVAVAVGLVE